MPKPNLFFKAIIDKPKSYQFSTARTTVRICYADETPTGDNRLLTDSAIGSLMKTLLGIPVVGFWDEEKQDFGGHLWDGDPRKSRFGHVPDSAKVYTEKDEMGRSWLCSDVLIWTQFPGSEHIYGKSQSMELNENNYEYSIVEKNGQTYVQFEYVEAKALCVLGDDVTPAYRGSQFFTNKPKILPKEEKQTLNKYFEALLKIFTKAIAFQTDAENKKIYFYNEDVKKVQAVTYSEENDKVVIDATTVEDYVLQSQFEAEAWRKNKDDWEVIEAELKEQLSANTENFNALTAEKENLLTEKNTLMEEKADLEVTLSEVAAEYKKNILSKYDGVFSEEELSALLEANIKEFKVQLGLQLVDKNFAVNGQSTVVPNFSHDSNPEVPDWFKAAKDKIEN